MLKVIADNHWSEGNRNSYAFWPRLANRAMDNNYKSSTWWMNDGSFLRLKSIELGYSLPTRLLKNKDRRNAYLCKWNKFINIQ